MSSTTMRPGSRLTTTTWTALATGSSVRTVGGLTAISCACMASFRCTFAVLVIVLVARSVRASVVPVLAGDR